MRENVNKSRFKHKMVYLYGRATEQAASRRYRLRDGTMSCVTQLTFRTVAAYPYKQCRPLHGSTPEVSASLELRDATKSAVTQVIAA
ncbi:hypothetical protein JCGZ_22066 [Jatropha curcas]|uniref:Uncharacterized protein n=1 Tax=Jatropha curcas TaxID=180498 RepID=A0A067K5B0_JATCU|nr:hypothetical protein JCGZ_22066 [Jatropha curcas]